MQNVSEFEVAVGGVVSLEEHDFGEVFHLESLGGLLVGETGIGVHQADYDGH